MSDSFYINVTKLLQCAPQNIVFNNTQPTSVKYRPLHKSDTTSASPITYIVSLDFAVEIVDTK